MTQKKIKGDQLDLSLADGSLLTGVDAALLNGENNAALHAAGSLTGFVADAQLNGPYNFNLTGNLTGNADSADDSDALGGVAAASWAMLASPVFTGNPEAPTQLSTDDSTRLATTEYVTNAVSGSGATVITGSEVTYTGSSTTYAMGGVGGTLPNIVGIFARCIVADNGYSINDVVSLNHVLSETDSGSGPQNEGIAVEISTTTVTVRVANRGILILNTSNVNAKLTANRWKLYYKVIV